MLTRWLARLSWSFLIVGVALAYQGYQLAQRREIGPLGQTLMFCGAGAFVALFFAGVRARHRHRQTHDSAPPR